MTSAAQIHEQLASFLADEQSLNAFHGWLARNTWDNASGADPEARDLAGAIELALAEFSDGAINRKELANQLSRLSSRGQATTKHRKRPAAQK